MNIYLDIDGVLLANDYNSALHVHEFLQTVEQKGDVHWLTTHCDGDASVPVKRLSLVLPEATLAITRGFKPTSWKTAKTEAINFEEEFLWFDDDLFADELEVMVRNGCYDNWIEVNLSRNPEQLLDFINSFPLPKQALGQR